MKHFFLKLSLFGLIIFVSQLTIATIYPPALSDEVYILRDFLREKAEVVFLGDSTVTVFDPQDQNFASISDMVQSKLPKVRLRALNHPAYQADVYLELGRYLAKSPHRPRVLVVPINLRSFSPEWDRRPVFQFEFAKYSLKYDHTLVLPFINFLINMNAFRILPISDREFENTPVKYGYEKVGTVKDFENIKYLPYSDENMQRIITYFYMNTLTPAHRKIKSFLALADLYKQKNIILLYYLTPIDYETGEKYSGNLFKERLTQNTDLLKTVLSPYGANILDLTFSLDSSFFTWSENRYINEHLKEKGRDYVAAQIASKIEELLPN